MDTDSQTATVFDNLIDVSDKNFGRKVEMVAHEPFSCGNARGTIAPMSARDIAVRARQFGERILRAQQQPQN